MKQKASAEVKEATSCISNLKKPTGVVQPSPQTIPSPKTIPSPRPSISTSTSFKANGSLVQPFSIPLRKTSITMSRSKPKDVAKVVATSTELPESVPKKTADVPPRPVFVPRQIKAQGKPKLNREESKNITPKKEQHIIKLSHLTQDEDDKSVLVSGRNSSTMDATPVEDSLAPSKTLSDVPSVLKATSAMEETASASSLAKPPSLGIAMDTSSPLSPPRSFITLGKDLSTSPKVALVSPQARPGVASSKPVARVRPSPHITTPSGTASGKTTDSATAVGKAASLDVARDEKNGRKSLFTFSSPNNSKVDSTTSGDVVVSPDVYGPDLPADHVTTTQDHVTSTHTQDPCIRKSTDSVPSPFDSTTKHSSEQQKTCDDSHDEGGVSSSDQKWISLKEKVEIDQHRNSDTRGFVGVPEASKLSVHSREMKHSANKAGNDTNSHHKHKKTLGEFWKVHSKEKQKRDRDRELDKHFESESDPLSSRKKRSSGAKKDRYRSRRKQSRSRSPSSDSRSRSRSTCSRSRRSRSHSRSPPSRSRRSRSRSHSPPSHSRRSRSRSRSPHFRRSRSVSPSHGSYSKKKHSSKKHPHHRRPHSHWSESNSERVKWKSRSISRSPHRRKHLDERVKTKKSPVKHGSARLSADGDVRKKKRRRESYSAEKSLTNQKHKLEKPETESVDKHAKNISK